MEITNERENIDDVRPIFINKHALKIVGQYDKYIIHKSYVLNKKKCKRGGMFNFSVAYSALAHSSAADVYRARASSRTKCHLLINKLQFFYQ